MLLTDGHIHTPYCPHGSRDSMAAYCEKAVQLGIKTITFTEHAPLPAGFIDPTPASDSAMNAKDLPAYLSDIAELKKEYAPTLDILTGLEVDYIAGFEQETTTFLNQIGPFLDDSILSVHFLIINDAHYCMDYSADEFAAMANKLGSIDALYKLYFKTVLESVYADLGAYKPKRIGHMTLCRKFQKRFPATRSFDKEMYTILAAVKEQKFQLDYNGAGVLKPDCGETYPPANIAVSAKTMGVPLIYGSDAHATAGLLSGSEEIILGK